MSSESSSIVLNVGKPNSCIVADVFDMEGKEARRQRFLTHVLGGERASRHAAK
jgi:hypothetical protein